MYVWDNSCDIIYHYIAANKVLKYYWYWLMQYKCIVWLFLWNVSWNKINCYSSSVWYGNDNCIINNIFSFVTLYQMLYNDACTMHMVSRKLSQMYKQYSFSILSFYFVFFLWISIIISGFSDLLHVYYRRWPNLILHYLF